VFVLLFDELDKSKFLSVDIFTRRETHSLIAPMKGEGGWRALAISKERCFFGQFHFNAPNLSDCSEKKLGKVCYGGGLKTCSRVRPENEVNLHSCRIQKYS
jgi:hypothetical protein